jgi:hypothetical protein
VSLTYRVQLRGDVRHVPAAAVRSPESPAYHAYRENSIFRPAFVCPPCYAELDNPDGLGEIGGRVYNVTGRCRGGRAPLYDGDQYRAYQRREAARLGLRID